MKDQKQETYLITAPQVKVVVLTADLSIKVDLWYLKARFTSSDYIPEANYKSLFMRHRSLHNLVQVTPQGKLVVNAKTELEGRQDLHAAAQLILNVLKA